MPPFASRIDPLVAQALRHLHLPGTWARPVAALLSAVVIFVAFWFGARLIAWVFARLAPRLTRRTRTDLDDRLVELLRGPIAWLARVYGLYLAVLALPLPTRLERLLAGTLYVVAVGLVVRTLMQVATTLIGEYLRRVDPARAVELQKEYVPLLRAATATLLILFGLVAVIHHFGGSVSSLLTAIGVGGAAIGLAAKDVISQVLAGLTILLDRPFRPGDRVQLATLEIGDVLTIGVRATHIKLLNGNVLVVPNSELVTTRVANFNYPTSVMQVKLTVPVAYGTDLERARGLMLEVTRAHPDVLADPPPSVQAVSLGDFSVGLELCAMASDFLKVGDVGHDLRREILRRFDEAQVIVPFPTRTLHHVDAGSQALPAVKERA